MTKQTTLKKVGEDLKVEQVAKEFNLNSFDLAERASDAQIEEALGEKHLFDKGEVYVLIGNLISKQANGEEGALLNNGYSNIFYTASCVVSVDWSSGAGGWDVYAWRRGGSGWGGGGRVFSPATSA